MQPSRQPVEGALPAVVIAALGQPPVPAAEQALIEELRSDPPPMTRMVTVPDLQELVELLGQGLPVILIGSWEDGQPPGAISCLTFEDLSDEERSVTASEISLSAVLLIAEALWGSLPPVHAVAISIAAPSADPSPLTAAAILSAAGQIRAFAAEVCAAQEATL